MAVPKTIKLQEARALVDVGIITIKREEFAAVLKRLPTEIEAKGKTQYYLAPFADPGGRLHYAAVVRSYEQGDISVQAIAGALISDLEPRLILLVGIAGARPEKEFTLGDVIVATRMFNFSVTAANADGTKEYATRGAPAHRVAEGIGSNLVADAAKYGDWQGEASIGMQRPRVDLSEKNIKGPPDWRRKIREALEHYFGPGGRDRQPIVIDGAIGSSSTLIKDPALFAEWLDKSREVKAVDMEISGVFEAARSVTGDLPVIVIRGLSDVIGFKRDTEWTEYACESAAAFCKALLCSGVLPLEKDSHENDGGAGEMGRQTSKGVRIIKARVRDWYVPDAASLTRAIYDLAADLKSDDQVKLEIVAPQLNALEAYVRKQSGRQTRQDIVLDQREILRWAAERRGHVLALGSQLLGEALREFGPGYTVGCIRSFMALSLVEIVFRVGKYQLTEDTPRFNPKQWCNDGSMSGVCQYVYNQNTLLIAYVRHAFGRSADVYIPLQLSTYLSLWENNCECLPQKAWREVIVPQMAWRELHYHDGLLELLAEKCTIHTNWKKMRGDKLIEKHDEDYTRDDDELSCHDEWGVFSIY